MHETSFSASVTIPHIYWSKLWGQPRIYTSAFFFPPPSSCQASKWFHANSQNVSYVVSVQKQSGKREKVCTTRWNYCTFRLRTKPAKLYLSAVNAAGKSNPTKVHILYYKGTALTLRNYLKMMARVIGVFFFFKWNACNLFCFCSSFSIIKRLSCSPSWWSSDGPVEERAFQWFKRIHGGMEAFVK